MSLFELIMALTVILLLIAFIFQLLDNHKEGKRIEWELKTMRKEE